MLIGGFFFPHFSEDDVRSKNKTNLSMMLFHSLLGSGGGLEIGRLKPETAAVAAARRREGAREAALLPVTNLLHSLLSRTLGKQCGPAF